MPSYKERKRLREWEQREAEGESFWTEILPPEAIRKIAQAIEDAETSYRGDTFLLFHDLFLKARDVVTRDTGAPNLPTHPEELVRVNDTDVTLSYVEAASKVLREQYSEPLAEGFAETVNAALMAHRVKYRFIPEDGQIVPLDSEEFHTSVVQPALVLLHGKPDFTKAHESYLKALKEISQQSPEDAITDAGTALQQTLIALGCRGNKLGKLINDARRRRLLAGHDEQLAAGVFKFMDWVSADRSEKGDAHDTGTESLDDAWLMVHIVGALIVRLAEMSPR